MPLRERTPTRPCASEGRERIFSEAAVLRRRHGRQSLKTNERHLLRRIERRHEFLEIHLVGGEAAGKVEAEIGGDDGAARGRGGEGKRARRARPPAIDAI